MKYSYRRANPNPAVPFTQQLLTNPSTMVTHARTHTHTLTFSVCRTSTYNLYVWNEYCVWACGKNWKKIVCTIPVIKAQGTRNSPLNFLFFSFFNQDIIKKEVRTKIVVIFIPQFPFISYLYIIMSSSMNPALYAILLYSVLRIQCTMCTINLGYIHEYVGTFFFFFIKNILRK